MAGHPGYWNGRPSVARLSTTAHRWGHTPPLPITGHFKARRLTSITLPWRYFRLRFSTPPILEPLPTLPAIRTRTGSMLRCPSRTFPIRRTRLPQRLDTSLTYRAVSVLRQPSEPAPCGWSGGYQVRDPLGGTGNYTFAGIVTDGTGSMSFVLRDGLELITGRVSGRYTLLPEPGTLWYMLPALVLLGWRAARHSRSNRLAVRIQGADSRGSSV